MVGRLAIVFMLASAPAHAQHDHAADEHDAPGDDPAMTSRVSAGVALVAASFDTMLYLGNYQGVVPSVRWSYGRVAAVASGAVYRVEENGARFYGLGDAVVHGQATLVSARELDLGMAAGVSLPTGDSRHGMGMGHVMVMPAAFAAWSASHVRFAAAVGYSRALGDMGDHDHGTWPLVSPMLVSEVSWNAGGDVRIAPRVSAGARASGGLPAGEGGDARAMVAGRVAWRMGRLESSFELQAGVVGDPFVVRGVVSTMLNLW